MTVFSRVIFSSGLLWALLVPVLQAQETVNAYTLDFPFGANVATPAWLGQPQTPSGQFASLVLPITSPAAGESLLVTVFFQEKAGGFLRISWQGSALSQTESDGSLPGPGEAGQSAVLSGNFYEGIGMSNQRSLLVSADTVKQPGELIFQCGDSALNISRIQLEWLQTSSGLSSPSITDVLVTPANSKTQLASELQGLPAAAEDPMWHGRIVDVPITDVPLRVEQGVDFTLQMDSPPATARLSMKEAGLAWGQHLVVWINNQRAGVIDPAVPELNDPGYSTDPSVPYVGWREGTFYVPTSSLVAGSNTVQFSAESDAPTAAGTDSSISAAPLAVKDVSLQLDYRTEPTKQPTASPTSTPSSSNGSTTNDFSSPVVTPPADQEGTTPAPVSSDLSAPINPIPNPQNPGLLSLPTNSAPSAATLNTP
jgi:hypothetical protein